MGGLLIFGGVFAVIISAQLFLLILVKLYLPYSAAVGKGVPLTPYRVALWRLTGVPTRLMVETFLLLREEGPTTPLADIEAVYLSHTDRTDSPTVLAAMVRQEMHGED
jgi:hypothetical protein